LYTFIFLAYFITFKLFFFYINFIFSSLIFVFYYYFCFFIPIFFFRRIKPRIDWRRPLAQAVSGGPSCLLVIPTIHCVGCLRCLAYAHRSARARQLDAALWAGPSDRQTVFIP